MTSGLVRRARRAVPSPSTIIAGSLLWACAVAASARISLHFAGWQAPDAIGTVIALYAIAPLLAFAPALWLARMVSDGRRFDVRFAAHILALAALTLLLLAGLFGLKYRMYYAQWHDEPFTRIWFLQLVFTGAASTYHFAVLGLRLLVPFGFLALLGTSFAFARRMR